MNNTAQNKIERDKAAARIARLLFQYRSVHWSPDNIKIHTGIEKKWIDRALIWLTKKQYVGGRTAFFLTEKGYEYVHGIKQNVSVTTANSERKFKDEALLGIAERRDRNTGWMVSEQSELTAAVLPGAHTPATLTTPEDMFLRRQRALEQKAKIAKRLGCTEKELEQHIDDERLRYCKSCESMELFDSKGKGRWQPVCRKCRKMRRG